MSTSDDRSTVDSEEIPSAATSDDFGLLPQLVAHLREHRTRLRARAMGVSSQFSTTGAESWGSIKICGSW